MNFWHERFLQREEEERGRRWRRTLILGSSKKKKKETWEESDGNEEESSDFVSDGCFESKKQLVNFIKSFPFLFLVYDEEGGRRRKVKN